MRHVRGELYDLMRLDTCDNIFSARYRITTPSTKHELTYSPSQKVTPRAPVAKISRTKGHLSKRTAFVRDIVKEVAGLAPYERRVIELLRNSKDKRARKLAKRRVSLHLPPCTTPKRDGTLVIDHDSPNSRRSTT